MTLQALSWRFYASDYIITLINDKDNFWNTTFKIQHFRRSGITIFYYLKQYKIINLQVPRIL